MQSIYIGKTTLKVQKVSNVCKNVQMFVAGALPLKIVAYPLPAIAYIINF